MAYSALARWYDALNGDADYDALAAQLCSRLLKYGAPRGIIADLGCGTGEICLRLAAAGYDMIGIDASCDMLGVLRGKAEERGRGDLLLLCQDLAALDLYGTIKAAVSTFDTFNHLPAARLTAALRRAALFTEPGGLLLFDVNTPYKYEHILANRTYEAEAPGFPGLRCEWRNRTAQKTLNTRIDLCVWQGGAPVARERFTEYCHRPKELEKMLNDAGYELLEVTDGERFTPPHGTSQRHLYVARKAV